MTSASSTRLDTELRRAHSMDSNSDCNDAEIRFKELCRGKLPLDDECLQQVTKLYQATLPYMGAETSAIGTSNVEEVERLWMTALLYVVKKMDNRVPPPFTLSQILRTTGCSVVDFYKELPTQVLLKCEPALNAIYGEDFERKLQMKEDQSNFLHLMVLFNYYQRLYPDYFATRELDQGHEFPLPQRFGWLLFLALRTHVLGRFPDLVTCTHALLAVFAIMIIHMPISSMQAYLENKNLFPIQGPEGVNLIASVACIGDASEGDVMQMVEKTQELITTIFPNLPATSCSNVNKLLGFSTTEGLTYFEGLMDDQMLETTVQVLERDYDEAYDGQGDLDERLRMSGQETYENVKDASACLQCKDNSQGSVAQPTGSPSNSPCSSPAKTMTKMPPRTPVSTTMTTAKWLRTVITPLPAEPTIELLDYFKACDRDITEEVKYRAKVILEGIFPSHPARGRLQSSIRMDAMWAEQRRVEAIKLYYRVLYSLCRAESQRLNNNNLTSVLTNEKFHRCMLACSAELVLATHKTVVMTFPAVLEPTGITAFDLSKVIESFVRYEETLPRELKRHLNSIEEKLVESMAWEKGSSMYNSLIVAKPRLAQEITRLGLLAEPMPSLDMLLPTQSRPAEAENGSGGDTLPDAGPSSPERQDTVPCAVTPVRDRPSAFSAFNSARRNAPNLQSVFASPHRPNPQAGGETFAETVITVFFQKVMKLAAIRIKAMTTKQPGHIVEHIYRVMHYAINNATSIFFNRHIDQIMLCAMYGVSKVMKLGLTFKMIISLYRKQPFSKQNVFRSVFLDIRRGRAETGDIIKFYNDIFVPSTKSFLMNITAPPPPAANGDAPVAEEIPIPSSKPSTFPALPDMSPKKVSNNHNVFVSPLRNTKVENIMSPHSRSLYACVGESTHAYQSPSKDLTAINNRLNNRNRFGRLDFDDAALMSDSYVAGAFANHNAANGGPSEADQANNQDNQENNQEDNKDDVAPESAGDEEGDPPTPPAKRARLDG